jgi:glutathione S-transferase
MSAPKLYTFPISPNGKRVRICALELGVPLDVNNVDFAKGEQRTPAYLALNPMGKAPTLVDDDVTLWESSAILWYLASQHAPNALYPTTPAAQADVLRWLFFCACHVDPYFTTLMVERFLKARRGLPADEERAAVAVEWVARFVPVLEQQLSTREYVCGAFGLADIVLGCTFELAPLVRYDLTSSPHILAWLDRLHARPSFRAPAPSTGG